MADHPNHSDLKKQQLQLQKPGKLKRGLSWSFFVFFLAVCLILPLTAAMQNTIEPTQSVPFAFDSVWNPGPLAVAHEAWQNDCQACHTGGFQRVADTKCAACHQNTGLHVTEKNKLDTHFEQGRCASCHREHKGKDSLAQQNRHFGANDCASCHSSILNTAPNTSTLPLEDFDNRHPEFRLTIADEMGKLQRVRMHAKQRLTEPTPLKFPHKLHLAKNGIDSPREKKVMQCADCHTPADTRSGFLPISMEKNCQSCHLLNFEPALPDRQVTHGSVETALSTLDEFYAYLALNPSARAQVNQNRSALRNRPGEVQAPRSMLQTLQGSPRQQAQLAARTLFEKSACVVCHVVKPLAGPGKLKTSGTQLPQYDIAKPAPAHAWMPQAKFKHETHAFEGCETCHEARQSSKAQDVLMPDIQTCQTCHSGRTQVPKKVRSECSVCHDYHLHEPMAAKNSKPAVASPVVQTSH